MEFRWLKSPTESGEEAEVHDLPVGRELVSVGGQVVAYARGTGLPPKPFGRGSAPRIGSHS